MNTAGATQGRQAVRSGLQGVEAEAKQSNARMVADADASAKKMDGVYDTLYRSRVKRDQQYEADRAKAEAQTTNAIWKNASANAKRHEADAANAAKAVEREVSNMKRSLDRLDPFQTARNQHPVAAGRDISRFNHQFGPNSFASQLKGADPFQTAKLVSANNVLQQIEQNANKATGAFSMFGQAFKGAFVGAVAGITFSTIIGGITGIADAIWGAAKAGVQAAADLETTRNALTLFMGSTSAAEAEIESLNKLAMRTPGLRLEDARMGSARLQALGFEAKVASNLIEGLAKQKLISGVKDEGAMSRVIINLQQLRAGSPQVQRDIQQMVLAIPSLSREIDKAFGSIDGFKKALREDPNGAITKFGQSLADAQSPAAGFNVALENLLDQMQMAGEEFGKPILDPLTDAMKEATLQIHNNKDTWASWGGTVADAISGAMAAYREYQRLSADLGFAPDDQISGGRLALRQGGRFISDGVATSAIPGLSTLSLGWSILGGIGGAEREANAERDRLKNASFKWGTPSKAGALAAKRAQALSIKDRNAEMDALFGRDNAIVGDNFAVQQKSLGLMSKDTIEDEKKYQAAYFALKDRQVNQQIDLAKKQYAQMRELADGDAKEIVKINADETKALSGFQREILENRIDNSMKIRDLEKRAAEERRRDHIASGDIILRAEQQFNAARLFDIERRITQTGEGYQDLVKLSADGMLAITANVANNLSLQLQNEKLTQMERVNLTRDANLKIEDAQEQHRQKLIQISDRQREAMFQSWQSVIGSRQGVDSAVGSGGSLLMDQLRGGVAFGADLPDIGLGPLIGDTGSSRVWDLLRMGQGGDSAQARDLLTNKLRQKQGATMDAEIRRTGDQIEMERIGGKDGRVLSELIGKRELLKLTKEIFDTETAITTNTRKRTETLAGINAFTAEIASGSKDALITEQSRLDFATQYQNVILESRTQQIALGDTALVQQAREINLLREQIGLRNEEFEAVLRLDRATLRNGQKLVYSKTRADADVAEFLASQKGITDIVSDTKINMLTTAYAGLDAVANRLTRSFGMFRDVARDLLANLAKLALNWIMQKMMGGGSSSSATGGFSLPGMGGGGAGGGGGFSVPGFSGFGIGPGGTAAFNGAAGTGVGGAYNVQQMMASGAFGSDAARWGGGGMLGPAGATTSVGGGIRGALSGFAGALPFMGAGLGAQIGRGSIGGSIMGGLGGLALGGAGAVALLGGAGAPIFASGGALSGLGGLAGFLANPFTIAGAGALLVGAYFLSRNAARRRDERTRNQASLDAFAALDQLIKDVENDKIDGTGALAAADAIRKQYLDTVGALKDKKTREIALREVSRVDSKIATLKDAVQKQISRRERLELMAPTFAYGGMVSPGLQRGPGSGTSDSMMGFFPSSGTYARYSNNEYVLDAETTRNVGPHNLDTLRATKGASYGSMRQNMPVNSYAAGGIVTPSLNGGGAPQAIELSLNVGLAAESFVQVMSSIVRNNNGSQEQVATLVRMLKQDGAEALVHELKRQLNALGS